MAARPGWYPDPWAVGSHRWWDGTRWTPQVAHPRREAAPPLPTLPLWSAIGGLVVILLSLLGSRVLLDALAPRAWPIAVYVLIGGVVGYGPAAGWCAFVVRRVGRRWGDVVGWRVRAMDAGWGPVTWLASFGSQILVGVIVVALGIPFTGNTEGLDSAGSDRGYLLSLAVLAVVAAPLFEELLFRGVVLRGFASAMPIPAAVVAQGLLFGCAHIDPVRGAGNIGLVLVLSAVGVVLGTSAVLTRRLASPMIAHAILNSLALTIAWLGLAG